MLRIITTYAAVLAVALTGVGTAISQSTSTFPSRWLNQALCIHRNEGYWHDRRNPSYRGGMQFSYTLWRTTIRHHAPLRRMRLPADPADASRYEQLKVTWYRYHDEPSPWSDWLPFDHAYYCVR
jgi:hypothetical protein